MNEWTNAEFEGDGGSDYHDDDIDDHDVTSMMTMSKKKMR